MRRTQVFSRVATYDDLPVVLTLWEELQHIGGRAERAINPLTVVDVRERFAQVLTDPACRVVVACLDDTPVGMAVLQVTRPDPLSDSRMLHIAHLVVARSQRHRGVGHVLLAAAADFAAELHIDHVAAGVYASLREVNRFYARLGFAPMAVRRVAPLAVLRRRLGQDRAAVVFGDGVRRPRLGRSVASQRGRRPVPERIDR